MPKPDPQQEHWLFSTRWLWWLPFGETSEKLPRQLFETLNSSGSTLQLLDVRTHKEWSNGHILGAINIPITKFRSRVDKLQLDPKRPTLAICRSAHRSIPAVRLLKRKGFSDVSQLAGGMNAWRQEGLPVSTP